MGYRIIYGNESEKYVSEERIRPGRVAAMIAVFLILFSVVTAKLWPEGAQTLQDFLLPGDPVVTRQALETMAVQLKAGERIGDVVVTFCQEIVDGAQITD